MHYYKRHLGDYSKKAGHLSPLEHGVYNLIIDNYYDREHAPTLVEATRWARARTEEEKAAVLAVLDEFFTLDGERYVQTRIEEELASYHGKAKKNREIAAERERLKREGSQPPKAKTTKRAQGVNDTSTDGARIVHETCTAGSPDEHDQSTSGQPNHKPLTTNHKPRTNNPQTPASPDGDAEFLIAWAAYPKRPGASRADAFKAWSARRKEGVAAETLIAGVRRYAAYVANSRIEPQFVKQPATFFGPGEHYAADWSAPATGNDDKFHVAHLDHSSSNAAMEASMKRHGVVIPDGDDPINFD
jgi:uncharacterized protein YdaU (DUF1376 family)